MSSFGVFIVVAYFQQLNRLQYSILRGPFLPI